MSAELTKVLLAAPAIIPPTMLSYQLAGDVAKLFDRDLVELTMLHGPVATRGAFLLSMESQPDLVIYMGHGTTTSLCGESFFCDMLTTSDASYLRNKVVIANPACDTGVELAPAAIQAGARCFMGALTPMYAAFPEEERGEIELPMIEPKHVATLEKQIDEMLKIVGPLQNFILPGGTAGAAQLQVARAVCRRAERSVVTLSMEEKVSENALVYLNRLSDTLFTMARFENHQQGTSETLWNSLT